MPTPISDNPTAPHVPAAPTIGAHGHVVTGIGFLPGHNVTIRIARADDDINDYLAYTTDCDGYLHAELPTSVTGMLHIAATDHRLDPAGECRKLWSNTYFLAVADT